MRRVSGTVLINGNEATVENMFPKGAVVKVDVQGKGQYNISFDPPFDSKPIIMTTSLQLTRIISVKEESVTTVSAFIFGIDPTKSAEPGDWKAMLEHSNFSFLAFG